MTDNTMYLTLTPRDPLIARDGRPFGAGQGIRMRSLDWFTPSVLAGTLRTMLGRLDPRGFDGPDYEQIVDNLRQVTVAGPFPFVSDGHGQPTLYFPAPKDLAVEKNHGRLRLWASRPCVPQAGGCDLPNGLSPVMLSPQVMDDFKPDAAPLFWSGDRMEQWLTSHRGDDCQAFFTSKAAEWSDGFLKAPEKSQRTHVQIAFQAGAAEEGMLFQTVGLELERLPKASRRSAAPDAARWNEETEPAALAVRVNLPANLADLLTQLPSLQPLGGERRLIHCSIPAEADWAPRSIAAALKSATRIRMVLATPGLFADGWKPRWIDRDSLEGEVPNTGVRLKLVGTCVDRWQPISGWSLERRKVGPKAVRRLVPAGSVYFFELAAGQSSAEALADRWLESVCDDPQDGRDGFGLALWGVWDHFDNRSFSGGPQT